LRWAWPRKIGGDERIRTADPLVANEVLSQLSYIPTKFEGLARTANRCAHASNRAAGIIARAADASSAAGDAGAQYRVRRDGGERGIRTLEAV
jgi:hypothetical protein